MTDLTGMIRSTLLFSLILFSLPVVEAESRLYFPRISGSGINGLTIFNPGPAAPATAADEVTLRLYDSDGALVSGAGITNPAVLQVAPGQNTAVLATEVFGALDPELAGWVEGTSEREGLTGFFLFLSPDQSRLDGADQPRISRKVAFNDIRDSEEFTAEINVFNTADTTTQLDLDLYTPQDVHSRTVGAPVAPGFPPTFPARGLLRIDNVADFFDLPSIPEGSFLEVLSRTPIGGFEFLKTSGGDLLGLNAKRRLEHLKVLDFPQLAVRGPWKMEVNVVSYWLEPLTLVFTATRPDGQPYGAETVARNPVHRNLDPFFGLVEDVEDLFGFSGEGPFEGSLRVEAYREGAAPQGGAGSGVPLAAINGSVRYGVVGSGSEAAVAALPEALTRAVFSHLATVEGFFTGFAAYNSSSAASNLRVMAFTEGGAELGLFDTILGPGQRIAELITNIIPGAAGQNGGYVWAKSSRPLHFSSLFGSGDATVLANIPPQPVPDSFLPDAGKPDFKIDPPALSVNLAENAVASTMGGTGAHAWSINDRPGGSNLLGRIDADGNYQAPGTLPEPPGPLTLTAADGDLIAAATLDLLELDAFNQDGIPGFITRLAYVPGVDKLYGVLEGGTGGSLPAGPALNSVIEIERDSQTTLVDLPGEEVSDLLPFESSVGESFLLVLSRTTDRLFRVDLETGTPDEIVSGLDGPIAMAWNPVSGNLMIADENSLYSVSRVGLESDLVSGLPANGREKVALVALDGVLALGVDACSGQILWANALGEVQSFDALTGEVATVVDGFTRPQSLLALYRRDAGCSRALRLLVADQGAHEIRLYDPADSQSRLFGPILQPADLVFVEDGLETGDVVLAASPPATPTGGGQRSDILTWRAPAQHQSDAGNRVGRGSPGSAADPLGDVFGSGPVQQDALDLSAYYDESAIHLTVAFAESISPCNELCVQGLPLDALAGAIDLDLDRDPGTGLLPLSDLNSPPDSGLGADGCASFSLYDENLGGLPIFVLVGDFFEEVGRVPVDFSSHAASFSIPLAMIGGEGAVNVAGVFGTSEQPTEVVPNVGFITSISAQEGASQSATAAFAPASRGSARQFRHGPVAGWTALHPVKATVGAGLVPAR